MAKLRIRAPHSPHGRCPWSLLGSLGALWSGLALICLGPMPYLTTLVWTTAFTSAGLLAVSTLSSGNPGCSQTRSLPSRQDLGQYPPTHHPICHPTRALCPAAAHVTSAHDREVLCGGGNRTTESVEMRKADEATGAGRRASPIVLPQPRVHTPLPPGEAPCGGPS